MSSNDLQPSKKIRLNPGETEPVSTTSSIATDNIKDETINTKNVDAIDIIDKKGNIVHLTNFDINHANDYNNIKEEKSKKTNQEEVISIEQIYQNMANLLDQETTDLVKDLINNGEKEKSKEEYGDTNNGSSSKIASESGNRGGRNKDGDNKNSLFVMTKPIADKETRTTIHHFFKRHFGNKLNTETKEEGMIKISFHTNKSRYTRNNRKEEAAIWDKLGGSYCQFVLYKENRDTMEAVNNLCKALKVPSKVFSYAGTKDQRAITTQKVTASKMKIERLAGLNHTLKGMKLGNFEYIKDPLKLGDLNGNHFAIILRDVKVDSVETIKRSIKTLEEKGFINYYGMQRFGTSSIGTHEIGRALLQNNWEEAVDLLLRPRIGERPDIARARQHWQENKDAKQALELFPRRCIAEYQILSSFVKTGHNKDCYGAFMTIPRNLRLMYLHSYQSYIWNTIVSERIRVYGCDSPVVGDLIIVDKDLINNDNDDEVASVNGVGGDDGKYEKEDNDFMTNSDDLKEIKVKILKKEDLSNYTINDVVLPLPGYSVIYPDNIIFDKYKELMYRDKLDPRSMRRSVKKLFKYDEVNVSLSLTDLDIINGKVEPENGKYVALRINFSLSTSKYATMTLRELMKSTDEYDNEEKKEIS
ncbi:12923_t:CDS:10 [Entrophospora sp. SA101]|nr:6031_t:CDS:10 [Entrophospora sp. SA101]CAJ0906167.1 12923_t:CDS:10 [Entrophospora sp. SA101]